MHAIALALLFAAPPEKLPATLDEKIAAALKSHPDIKAAEAKRLLAEAELEQARLLITQKVSAAAARVEIAKTKVEQAALEVDHAQQLRKNAVISDQEVLKARGSLMAAKAELAAAESELQQLIGPAVKVDAKPLDKPEAPKTVSQLALPTGPVVEKLERAALMTFELNFKEMDVKKALEGLMASAKLEDVPLRGLKVFGADYLKSPPKFDKLIGRNSLDGWVQLFMDELNADQRGLPEELKGRYELYVREYGFLVERVANAPKDAMTLSEFSKAIRAKPR